MNILELKKRNREIAKAARQKKKEQDLEERRLKKEKREAEILKARAAKEAKLLKKNSTKTTTAVRGKQEESISNEPSIITKEMKRELINETEENETGIENATQIPKNPEE